MNLKYFLKYLLLCVWASSINSTMSFAAIQDKKQIIIGTAIESSPYIIKDDINKGFDVDLFTVIFAKMGYNIKIIHQPINRLPTLLKDHKIDVLATWQPPQSTELSSMPYRYWQNAILTINDTTNTIDTPKALKGKIVGSFTGASKTLAQDMGAYIESFAAYYEIPSSNNAAKMLLSDRFDAYIGDIWAVSYFFAAHVKSQKKRDTLKVNYLFEPTPQILCFSDQTLRDQFDKELALFIATGDYDALKTKYFPNMPESK